MKFSKILVEGRVEDFENKYTQKYGAQNVQRIVNMVIPKYLDWVGRNFDAVNFDENYGKLVAALNNFDARVNATVVADAAKLLGATVVVFAHNVNGKSIAPAVSVKLGAGIVTGACALPKTDAGFIR